MKPKKYQFEDVELRPADLVLVGAATAGLEGGMIARTCAWFRRLLGVLIRFFSTMPTEPKTDMSHAEVVTKGGIPEVAETVGATFPRIRAVAFAKHMCCRMRVHRRRALESEARMDIADRALDDVGKLYGLLRLFAFVIDCTVSKVVSFIRWVFRRRPAGVEWRFFSRVTYFKIYICSEHAWNWHGYDKYKGMTPDDLDDYCMNRPDEWELVMEIQ